MIAGRRGSPVVSLLTLALVLICATALTPVVTPGRWLAVSAVLAAVAVTATAALRRWWRTDVLPSLVVTVAAVWALVVLYAGDAAGERRLPSPAALRDLGGHIRTAIDATYHALPPMAPDRDVELLLVGSILLIALITDLVAVGWGRPAIGGLLACALWAPSVVLRWPPPTVVFVASAMAYLLLLAATTPQGPRQRSRAAVTSVGAAGAVIAACLALTPLVVGMPGWRSLTTPVIGGGVGLDVGPVRLSTDLDLRDSLQSRSQQVMLSYSGDGTNLGPLRLFTTDSFDGRRWQPPGWRSTTPQSAYSTLFPDAVEPTAEPFTVDIVVGNLDDTRLPIPVEPRTVAGVSWGYAAQVDEVIAPAGQSTRGLSYSVQVTPRELTADLLAAAPEPDRAALAEYLQLPQTSGIDRVRALAEEITAGAQTPYHQAAALQRYLRDARNFTYSLEIDPPVSDDAVADFLDSGRGYCVQFATTMTVMARALGIPARLAVGFLPGSYSTTNQNWVVTGELAHAWPELYFPGTGWVRFEPTPAVQTGQAPSWTTGATSGQPENATESSTPSAEASASPSPSASQQAPADGAGGEQAVTAWWVVLGAAVVAVAVLVIRTLPWRRTRRQTTAETAWADVAAAFDAAGVTAMGCTPRTLAIRGAAWLVASGMAEEELRPALVALAGLRDAVESGRYAARPSARPPEALAEDTELVLRAIASATAAQRRAAAVLADSGGTPRGGHG